MSAKELVLQALKDAARARHSQRKGTYLADYLASDESAVRYGPLVFHVATKANTAICAARRYLRELEADGLVIREPPGMRGTAHRWWPVGFAAELRGGTYE